jgi:dienelactone hydrolase
MQCLYGEENQFHGTLYESAKPNSPGLLIIPAWLGKDAFAEKKAKELSTMGITTLAVDLYGKGKVAKDTKEAESLMVPLFLDRKELRRRLHLAFDKLSSFQNIDKKRIGALGFCFGGLSAIELLRSGIGLTSAISVHGLLGGVLGPLTAILQPVNYIQDTELLILHGAKDPLVSELDVSTLQKELNLGKVNWEMDIYGFALHAFTNPAADCQKSGLLYNEKAAKRAEDRIKKFLQETLQTNKDNSEK